MRFSRTPIAALLLLAAAACDSPTSGGDAGGGLITIRNLLASDEVTEVRIYGCSATTAGPNQLLPRQVIAPGQSRSFGVAEGCYNVETVTAPNEANALAWSEIGIEDGETETLVLD